MQANKRWSIIGIVLVSLILIARKVLDLREVGIHTGKKTPELLELKRQKVTHIGFLKVHKSGSSTMQNLFFRFGLKHNLNIILPKGGNFVGKRTDTLKTRDGNHYDIFAVHTVYKKSTFEHFLPPDAIYIGIVREPLDRMISAAYFYRDVFHIKYLRNVPADRFIQDLVNKPDIYDKGPYSQTRNTMARDFGFPSSMLKANRTVIQKELARLNREFRIVLVTELFDESLILMRRYLRWTLSDVVYLKTNTHSHVAGNLSEEEKAKFRSTCFLDYAIYNNFKREMNRKLGKEGEDFWLEVKHFKRILMDVSSFCKMNNSRKLNVNPGPWNEAFSVSAEDCTWMKTGGKPFINKLRQSMLNNDTVVP